MKDLGWRSEPNTIQIPNTNTIGNDYTNTNTIGNDKSEPNTGGD